MQQTIQMGQLIQPSVLSSIESTVKNLKASAVSCAVRIRAAALTLSASVLPVAATVAQAAVFVAFGFALVYLAALLN